MYGEWLRVTPAQLERAKSDPSSAYALAVVTEDSLLDGVDAAELQREE